MLIKEISFILEAHGYFSYWAVVDFNRRNFPDLFFMQIVFNEIEDKLDN